MLIFLIKIIKVIVLIMNILTYHFEYKRCSKSIIKVQKKYKIIVYFCGITN